jgi:hypothetical protein
MPVARCGLLRHQEPGSIFFKTPAAEKNLHPAAYGGFLTAPHFAGRLFWPTPGS